MDLVPLSPRDSCVLVTFVAGALLIAVAAVLLLLSTEPLRLNAWVRTTPED